MVKKISLALLGATGSIGSSTLEVMREHKDKLSLKLICAGSSYEKLVHIAEEFDVPLLFLNSIQDTALQDKIRSLAPNRKVYFGEEELLKALAAEDYDVCLNAIGASAGLLSSHAVIQRGKRLALANKESLVMAGHILRPMWLENKVDVIPVDSEHSAIFQAIGSHPASEIRKLHITASGGAFRTLALEDFASITTAQALKHPNWDMGAKVTLDSATMVNKALEIMEAHWLFGLPYEAIEAIIHPPSVIHSMVQFVDGSILAQLSTPDMKLPILYALSWPQRWASGLVQTDLLTLPPLEFYPIEEARYPLFYLGVEAAREGGLMPTAFNAANEVALKQFLDEKIRFDQIYDMVKRILDGVENIQNPSLEEVIAINAACRRG